MFVVLDNSKRHFDEETHTFLKETLDNNCNLTDGFIKESTDHMTYKLYAEQAELEGYASVSKLFKALAESEMIHARNMLIADGKVSDTMTNLSKFYESKKKQALEEYPKYIKEGKSGPYRSGYISFDSALMAEKMHVKLIGNTMNSMSPSSDLKVDNYYICQRCGYVHAGDSPIRLCPACGTSKYFFKLF